jgi:hypothetical protein
MCLNCVPEGRVRTGKDAPFITHTRPCSLKSFETACLFRSQTQSTPAVGSLSRWTRGNSLTRLPNWRHDTTHTLQPRFVHPPGPCSPTVSLSRPRVLHCGTVPCTVLVWDSWRHGPRVMTSHAHTHTPRAPSLTASRHCHSSCVSRPQNALLPSPSSTVTATTSMVPATVTAPAPLPLHP